MTEAREVLLEAQGVRKAYGARPALKGVDLAVRAGEFVALLGPNGAGKSTLFQLLTGLFDADAGELRVCGEDMRRTPVRALGRIGVVFQQMTLDLDLSVEANLVFHARLHGIGGAESRVRIADGHAFPAEAPGLGIEWDWPAVEKLTVAGSTATVS